MDRLPATGTTMRPPTSNHLSVDNPKSIGNQLPPSGYRSARSSPTHSLVLHSPSPVPSHSSSPGPPPSAVHAHAHVSRSPRTLRRQFSIQPPSPPQQPKYQHHGPPSSPSAHSFHTRTPSPSLAFPPPSPLYQQLSSHHQYSGPHYNHSHGYQNNNTGPTTTTYASAPLHQHSPLHNHDQQPHAHPFPSSPAHFPLLHHHQHIAPASGPSVAPASSTPSSSPLISNAQQKQYYHQSAINTAPIRLRAPPPSPNTQHSPWLSNRPWPKQPVSPCGSSPSASPKFAPKFGPKSALPVRPAPCDRRPMSSLPSAGTSPMAIHPLTGKPPTTRPQRVSNEHAPLNTYPDEYANGRCKTYCRELIAFLFSHLGLCLLLIGYMLMGAAIFQELEFDPNSNLHVPMRALELQNETLIKLFGKVRHLSVFADEQITETQLAGELNTVLADYTRRMVEHIGDGYDPNAVLASGNKWDFFGAFLYSLTIITTIGYGHIAPSRAETRVVTIVYAIFGIPLMLLYLTNIGGILAKSFRYIYTRLTHLMCGNRLRQRRRAQLTRQYTQRRRPPTVKPLTNLGSTSGNNHHTMVGPGWPGPKALGALRTSASSHSLQQTARNSKRSDPLELRRFEWRDQTSGQTGNSYYDPSMNDTAGASNSVTGITSGGNIERYEKVHVPITLCLLILIAYVTGGGMVFANWENWSRIEGAYFCFITLSTIGFGDYVPGKYVNKQVNFIVCSIYILVGLALIAMCFNLMQEGVKHKFRTLVRKIGVLKDKYAEPDDQLSDTDLD